MHYKPILVLENNYQEEDKSKMFINTELSGLIDHKRPKTGFKSKFNLLTW